MCFTLDAFASLSLLTECSLSILYRKIDDCKQ